MKRFLLLGVVAVFFMGCTITFDTGGDTNTSPTKPTLSITSPLNYSYFELADYSSITNIGTVLYNGMISNVYARWGATGTGIYSAVPGTALITPTVATAWTNIFDISSSSGGTKNMYFYAKDVEGVFSITNSQTIYLLDEDETNDTMVLADLIDSDGTVYFARIGVVNDIDWFKFTVASAYQYFIYTTNSGMGTDVDTVISLYDSSTNLITYDDGSAPWAGVVTYYDFIYTPLNTGNTYYLAVSKYNTNGIGDYSLVIRISN
jgi:hypothetical protein